LGAVLALVAMLGLIGVSGWHNAVIHDDAPIHVSSVEHGHSSSNQADPDAPIHVLAHATVHWVASVSSLSATPMFAVIAPNWPNGDYRLGLGIDPTGLLRPPRG